MEDKDLYIIAEIRYKKANSNIKEDELFPDNWYSLKNYHLKIEIIAEALQKNILIKDTKLYKDIEL